MQHICDPHMPCHQTITQTHKFVCFTDDVEFVDPDPSHSFEAVEQQVFGNSSISTISGFIEQALAMALNPTSFRDLWLGHSKRESTPPLPPLIILSKLTPPVVADLESPLL